MVDFKGNDGTCPDDDVDDEQYHVFRPWEVAVCDESWEEGELGDSYDEVPVKLVDSFKHENDLSFLFEFVVETVGNETPYHLSSTKHKYGESNKRVQTASQTHPKLSSNNKRKSDGEQ